MTEKSPTTPADVTELDEKDLEKIRGGDFSLNFRPTKVEIESISSTGVKSFKSANS